MKLFIVKLCSIRSIPTCCVRRQSHSGWATCYQGEHTMEDCRNGKGRKEPESTSVNIPNLLLDHIRVCTLCGWHVKLRECKSQHTMYSMVLLHMRSRPVTLNWIHTNVQMLDGSGIAMDEIVAGWIWMQNYGWLGVPQIDSSSIDTEKMKTKGTKICTPVCTEEEIRIRPPRNSSDAFDTHLRHLGWDTTKLRLRL